VSNMRKVAGVTMCTAAVVLGSTLPICAAVARTTLKGLTTSSEYIVVGRVTSVMELKGVSVATVRVSETLKGSAYPEIAFLAQGTWTCDISAADEGEEVLLFLERYRFDPAPQPEKDKDPQVLTTDFKEPAGFKDEVDALDIRAPFMAIAWSGRGRMPVRYVEGESYVTIWTMEVTLPQNVPTIDGPEVEYASFIRSAPMGQVLSMIRRYSR
jgi:hypothetical protein